MYDLLTSLGRRVSVINLDPAANPLLPYPCAVDVRELVSLSDVQSAYALGPNGGIVYCMEYLQHNLGWLDTRLAQLPPDAYLLVDFPGQVEVYTSSALDALFAHLHALSSHLTAVHLVDCAHLVSPSVYLSSLLLSLTSMVRLAFPHVNVLSKVDQLPRMGPLHLPLSFYTDVMDLQHLVRAIDLQMQGRDMEPTYRVRGEDAEAGEGGQEGEEEEEEYVEFETGEDDDEEGESEGEGGEGEAEGRGGAASAAVSSGHSRYVKLTRLLCELVESYALVSFSTLAIADKRSALRLLHTVDTSNGYALTNTHKEWEERGQGGQEGVEGGIERQSMFNLVHSEESHTQPQLDAQYTVRERHPPQGG